MSALWLLCRSIVAITFVLSAAWKLRNRADFNAVVAGGPLRLRGLWQTSLAPAVALLEIVIGAGLLLFPGSWPLGAAAVLFLVVFSVFLARAGSLANGCGCWRPVRRGSGTAKPFLVRNGLLIVLAGVGTLPSHGLGVGAQVTLAAAAALPAWMIMEIPTVAELLSSPARRRGPARVGGNL